MWLVYNRRDVYNPVRSDDLSRQFIEDGAHASTRPFVQILEAAPTDAYVKAANRKRRLVL